MYTIHNAGASMFVLDYAIKQCDTVCKKYGMKAIEKPKHQQTTYNTTQAKRKEKKKQNQFLANEENKRGKYSTRSRHDHQEKRDTALWIAYNLSYIWNGRAYFTP